MMDETDIAVSAKEEDKIDQKTKQTKHNSKAPNPDPAQNEQNEHEHIQSNQRTSQISPSENRWEAIINRLRATGLTEDLARFTTRYPDVHQDRINEIYKAEKEGEARRAVYSCLEPNCKWQKLGEEEDLRSHISLHIAEYKASARFLREFMCDDLLPTMGSLSNCPVRSCRQIFPLPSLANTATTTSPNGDEIVGFFSSPNPPRSPPAGQ